MSTIGSCTAIILVVVLVGDRRGCSASIARLRGWQHVDGEDLACMTVWSIKLLMVTAVVHLIASDCTASHMFLRCVLGRIQIVSSASFRHRRRVMRL